MLKAYPEYPSGEVQGRDYFSAMGSALNPAKPETFAFLDHLFGEMAALLPDQYFRVGGDEISGADWKANPQVQAFMKANGLKTLHELESYFFDRVREGVVAHGEAVVGWEEVARAAISDDVVVQPWRSSSAIARVTAQGNRVVATCGYSLDKLWPGEDHYRIDPQDPTACGLTHEQFAEGKAKGLPSALLAEDQVIDPSLKLSPGQQGLVMGWRRRSVDRDGHRGGPRQPALARRAFRIARRPGATRKREHIYGSEQTVNVDCKDTPTAVSGVSRERCLPVEKRSRVCGGLPTDKIGLTDTNSRSERTNLHVPKIQGHIAGERI